MDGAYSGAYQYADNNAQLKISADGIISGYYSSPYKGFYTAASANGKRVWHALNEYMGRHPEIAQTGGGPAIATYAADVSGMTPEMYANQGRQALLAQRKTAEQALALAFGAKSRSTGPDPSSIADMTRLAGDAAPLSPQSHPDLAFWSTQGRYDGLTARRRQMENTPLNAARNTLLPTRQLGTAMLASEHDDDDAEPLMLSGLNRDLGGVRFFSGLTGNFMHRDGSGDYGGYRYTSGGLLAGLAFALAPGWEAGGYAGFSRGHMQDDDTDSHSAVDGAHFGLFARFDHASGFKATTDLAYGHFWNYGTRKFFLGSSEQRYENKYQQDLLGLGLELAYDLDVVEHTRLTPYVGARYTHLWQDDFKEKTKGGSIADLALHTDAARADSFRSHMGLRLARDFQAAKNAVVTPSVTAGWLHEWADNNVELTSTLAGTGPSFSTRSASESRDELHLGLGLDTVFNLHDRYDLGIRAGYAVDLRAESQDHGVFLSMELSF